MVARLGPGAFETIGGHVVNVALSISTAEPATHIQMAGVDVIVRLQTPLRSAALLRGESIRR